MIKINSLNFSYSKKSPHILNDLNIFINKGDYVSVIGENGCGKTTLIKLMLGLLKPNSGSIYIDTKNIGYVPQKSDGLNSQFPITVYEMLYAHMKALHVKDTALIKSNLEKIGMYNFKNTLIGNLSGGQLQKIFIARALMGNPEVLILDEPSTGIDIQSQKEIYSIINGLNKDFDITVISIEHNLDAALSNSKHILQFDGNGSGKLLNINEFSTNYTSVPS